ncbi:tetratricopeptide repeat protein [Mesorhizobium sp. LHD-90]|uniref:tetratricopeptide repeat protein n=1 Tax=Mesorhizobium sp. LHD-90 TaxID=3071414 RepID=UPI0027DEFAB6|nr:tetratricopeptide repeat protein [Mesorhizobium sp. LHD-90]MDQ6436500.1 tetratricopeptide repeat protein [Mesorhizobium sp. LHD-90]
MQYRYALIVASALMLAAGPAFTAGGGGGDSGGSGSGSTPKCAAGKIYDKRTKKCVTQKSGVVDDDTIYWTGRQLAQGGDYEEAIKVLSLAENKNDPRILNYLGYSHRKAGRILVGLGYYEEALRADPNYTVVYEYLGEAHLQLGNVAAARNQLAEIEKRCGVSCEEYKELAEQIDAYKG